MDYRSTEALTAFGYLASLVLAAWGGAVNYLQRLKTSSIRVFTLAEMLGEMVISCFAGIVVHLLLSAANINPLTSAAIVAVSGHLGGKLLYAVEVFLAKQVLKISDEEAKKLASIDDDSSKK